MIMITIRSTGEVKFFNMKDLLSLVKHNNNLIVTTTFGVNRFKATDVDINMIIKEM